MKEFKKNDIVVNENSCWFEDEEVLKVVDVNEQDGLIKLRNINGTEWWDYPANFELKEDHDKKENDSHYKQDEEEVWQKMVKQFGREDFITFCKVNAFKYRFRAGYKDEASEDIRKALWYEEKARELSKSISVHKVDEFKVGDTVEVRHDIIGGDDEYTIGKIMSIKPELSRKYLVQTDNGYTITVKEEQLRIKQ